MRAPKQHPACSFNRNAQKIDCTLSMQSIERAALRISKRRPAKSELFCWRNKSLSLSLLRSRSASDKKQIAACL